MSCNGRSRRGGRRIVVVLVSLVGAGAGCGLPRFDPAALLAIESGSVALELALADYHRRVQRHADQSESRLIEAFVEQMRGGAADAPLAEARAESLQASLQHSRSRRAADLARFSQAMEQVTALRRAGQRLRSAGVAGPAPGLLASGLRSLIDNSAGSQGAAR